MTLTKTDSTQVSANSKHAQYQIELLGNVIRVSGSGVVTPSILQNYHRDVQRVVKPLKCEPWGFLGFAGGVCIMTPEAERFLVESIQFRKSLGMVACAMMTKDLQIPMLVRNQFQRVYEAANIAYRFCDNEGAAIQWLASQGCVTNLQQS